MNQKRIFPLLIVILLLGAGIYFLSNTGVTGKPGDPEIKTPCDKEKTPHYCKIMEQMDEFGQNEFQPQAYHLLVSQIDDYKKDKLITEDQSADLKKLLSKRYLSIISTSVSKHCKTASASGLGKSSEFIQELGGLNLETGDQTVKNNLLHRLNLLEEAFGINQKVVYYLTYQNFNSGKSSSFKQNISVYRADDEFKNNSNIISVLGEAQANLNAFEDWYQKNPDSYIQDFVSIQRTPDQVKEFFTIRNNIVNHSYYNKSAPKSSINIIDSPKKEASPELIQ